MLPCKCMEAQHSGCSVESFTPFLLPEAVFVYILILIMYTSRQVQCIFGERD